MESYGSVKTPFLFSLTALFSVEAPQSYPTGATAASMPSCPAPPSTDLLSKRGLSAGEAPACTEGLLSQKVLGNIAMDWSSNPLHKEW